VPTDAQSKCGPIFQKSATAFSRFVARRHSLPYSLPRRLGFSVLLFPSPISFVFQDFSDTNRGHLAFTDRYLVYCYASFQLIVVPLFEVHGSNDDDQNLPMNTIR